MRRVSGEDKPTTITSDERPREDSGQETGTFGNHFVRRWLEQGAFVAIALVAFSVRVETSC